MFWIRLLHCRPQATPCEAYEAVESPHLGPTMVTRNAEKRCIRRNPQGCQRFAKDARGYNEQRPCKFEEILRPLAPVIPRRDWWTDLPCVVLWKSTNCIRWRMFENFSSESRWGMHSCNIYVDVRRATSFVSIPHTCPYGNCVGMFGREYNKSGWLCMGWPLPDRRKHCRRMVTTPLPTIAPPSCCG